MRGSSGATDMLWRGAAQEADGRGVEVAMDFELSEEQRSFQDMARQFAAERLAPHAADWDQRCHFPVDALREAAGLGFAGIYAAEARGGAGLSRLDAAII